MNSLLVSTPQGTQPVRGNNDQEETEQRDFRRVLLRADSPVSPVLHGIRAEVAERQLFKHDAYKWVFKMEAAKDYYVWSFTMLKFLEGEGLKNLVLGTVARPSTPSIEASDREIRAYLKWKEANMVAERAIMSCIGKSQIGLLTRCQDAAEMWLRLKHTYAQDDETNIMRLQVELQGVTWKKSISVDSYIKHINDLADQLRCCGDEPSERTLTLVLLKGIPEKYDYIKHILLQQEGETFNRKCDKLRSHVGLNLLGESSVTGSAHVGASHTKVEKKGQKKQKKCTHCQMTGHTVNECFRKDPSKAGKVLLLWKAWPPG